VYSFHYELEADDCVEGLAGDFSECYFPWIELSYFHSMCFRGL